MPARSIPRLPSRPPTRREMRRRWRGWPQPAAATAPGRRPMAPMGSGSTSPAAPICGAAKRALPPRWASGPPGPAPPAGGARGRLAEPIAAPEALTVAIGELREPLCRLLAGERLGARRLMLTLYRVDGTSAAAAIGTARPSRDPRHLLRLLAERLVQIDPGLGIEDMVLAATTVEELAAAQAKLPLSPPRRERVIPERRGNVLPFPESQRIARQVAPAMLAA